MSNLIDFFSGGDIGYSIMLLAVTITLGIQLGKIKIANISLGITWILFVGIAISHFGFIVDAHLLHFAKEFGLILFVYSIGLQVGPGFFSSLKKGGMQLNIMAMMIVVLGCVTTYIIHLVTNTEMSTMVGVLSGAVTNTPGLGAAQQTYTDITGESNPYISLGYALAYPLGVIGIIISPMIIKWILRIKPEDENIQNDKHIENLSQAISIRITNQNIFNKSIAEIAKIYDKPVVFSRVLTQGDQVIRSNNDTVIHLGDVIRVVVENQNIDSIIAFLGERVEISEKDWEGENEKLISRRIVVTQANVHGKKIGSLNIRSLYKVNITRIHRSGIELLATNNLQLFLGDRVSVVGREEDINKVAEILGNSMKRLDHPNLIPIFLGVFLGIILGSIPIAFPGLPQPVKLGLAGGPLIVAILIARFGPYYKLITFTTTSANMMIREIGISMFLAAVGLGAGEKFVDALLSGGYLWVVYGLLITILPLLIVGIFARLRYKLDYYTLLGLLSGSMTDPPALAFANSVSSNDAPAVAYATVYPLTMFLRVLTAQILIIISI